MSSEWQITTFAEAPFVVIDGDRGANYPKQHEFSSYGYCLFLNAGNVSRSGFVFSDCAFITEEKDSILRKGKLARYDLVLTTRGTVGNVAYFSDEVPFSHIRINSGMVILRPDQSRIDPYYLYLFLRSKSFNEQVAFLTSGSAQPQLPIRDMNRVEMPLPPLEEQRKICSTLRAFDDQITLLRETNATLEAIAQALFKSWFVDFDPVCAKAEGRQPEGMDATTAALFPDSFEESELGLVPKGWSVACIGKIADVIDCLHAKKPELVDTGYPFLQLNNIKDDGLLDVSRVSFVTLADYQKWTSRVEVKCGDCVITNVGRVGAVSQIPSGFTAAMGRNMTAIRLRAEWPFPTYLIELMQSNFMRAEIVLKTDEGTILSALNVKSIPHLRCILPSVEIMIAFERVARPLRASMEENAARIQTLTQLRDTLLPRLISGQLRLPEAETLLEKAL